jgi:hypothetical protein
VAVERSARRIGLGDTWANPTPLRHVVDDDLEPVRAGKADEFERGAVCQEVM